MRKREEDLRLNIGGYFVWFWWEVNWEKIAQTESQKMHRERNCFSKLCSALALIKKLKKKILHNQNIPLETILCDEGMELLLKTPHQFNSLNQKLHPLGKGREG